MEKLLSRKFIAAILTIIMASGLMYCDKISDGVYSTIMVANITAYLAANVIQKQNTVTTQ